MPNPLQTNAATGTGTSGTVSWPSNVSAGGSLLFVEIASDVAATTVDDNGIDANFYGTVRAEAIVNVNNHTVMFYCANANAGAGAARVLFGSAANWVIDILEYPSVRAVSPLFGSSSTTGFGTAMAAPGVSLTAGNSYLLVGAATAENIVGLPVAPVAPATERLETTRGNTPCLGYVADRTIAGDGTSYAIGATLASATNWAMQEAAFIVTAVAVSLEQEGYRWRNDDGSETTATYKAAQDTTITGPTATTTRLRAIVNATGDPASQNFKVQYRKVGAASWRNVDKFV